MSVAEDTTVHDELGRHRWEHLRDGLHESLDDPVVIDYPPSLAILT